ncbi:MULTISPECIES: nuclear transport factor 2 family protein [Streptomyces]|uniref:nuclear transport factor 2 family protein n=1 Tax=Streptomyces TaxID=1883 RepID=UPI0019639FFC|nr:MULTISPECIES: nuclear transport factor 2 family protein [Streptomyces]QRX90599.1 nuclear transport factor 2 family protein [Streptomyces noursei]UJB40530.1 nuclear transport factor 2 family protein [Streptomyces sp. A1-5]
MRAESTAPSTRDTVENFLARLAAGDVDGVAALFAERVDWDVPGAVEVPWLGIRATRAEVADYFTTHPTYVTKEDFVVERTLVDGAEAAVSGRFRSRVIRNGAVMESWFVLQLTVSDGEITRYRFYEDSLAVARAWASTATGADGRAQEAHSGTTD